ncbi:MAG: hypothetical protein ACT452_18615 [Microthrixaceae bacterium]
MGDGTMKRLAPLVGEWSMEALFRDVPPMDARARVSFEWMPGARFLVERWDVHHPDAPDGIAIIGPDKSGDHYLQHYFDSRGVARVYEMSFDDGVWRLTRTTPDFTSLEFSQRFTGTLSDDGKSIAGRWEICHHGSTWEHDFDLTYTKVA